MVVNGPSISIGVLAHNEKLNIEKTLKSLFMQDVFERFSTEVIVVANGCTDGTATLAKQSLLNNQALWSKLGSAQVVELTMAGKTNAWNEFVHKLSARSAPILVLMDSDITLLNKNTISSLVTSLADNSEAAVCVDRPVKNIEIGTKRTLFQRLLVGATPAIDEHNAPLCGQLYSIRSAEARQITLPRELPVEDGFLRALLLTHGFTRPNNARRIILDSSVAHRFESVGTLRELFKHERWIVSSSIISMLLYERFWRECAPDRSAMELIARWQKESADWLPRYIQTEVQKRGWRLLPSYWWTRRWSHLRPLSWSKKLKRLPIAAMATAMDMFVFITAIRDVRKGRAFRYWGR